MATVTVEALLQKCNLEDTALDAEIDRSLFLKVSRCLTGWKLLIYELPQFDESDVQDIESDNRHEEERRLSFLTKLKQKLSANLTYRLLITTLLGIERAEDAMKLCKLLTEMHPESAVPPLKPKRPSTVKFLTMASHHTVTQELKYLSDERLTALGGSLGLLYPSMKRMKNLLMDLVEAWLNEEDNVEQQPCWSVLISSLYKIGQKGLAKTIAEKYTS